MHWNIKRLKQKFLAKVKLVVDLDGAYNVPVPCIVQIYPVMKENVWETKANRLPIPVSFRLSPMENF